MHPNVMRRVKQMRTNNPWMRLDRAVLMAHAEESPNVGAYEFLADFAEDKDVSGTVGPFTVRVRTEQDESFALGEDDVTGTFVDTWEPGCIANTGATRGAYKWYRPSSYALTALYEDLKRSGLSRSVAREQYARILQAEMDDDRERYALGVIVTVSLDDDELGDTALWGIDQIPSVDGRPYLIDVARELIDEVIAEARATLPRAIKRNLRHVAKLRRALKEAGHE